METKRNLKYFTSKGVNPLVLVGVALLLVGIGFVVFASRGMFTLRIIGVVLAVFGLGVIIFVSGGIASGDDIEYACGEKMRDMTEEGMKRFELFEKSLKFLQPVTIRGYEFTDDVYYKKGSDGKNRTSIFSAAILFFTGDKLYIHRRRFSFIDDTLDETLGGSYRYADLDHAEVQEHKFERMVGKRNIHFTDYHFVILDKAGESVLDMSVEYGADTDKLCSDMNRIIDIRTKAYEEKLARVEAERAERLAAAAKEAEEKKADEAAQ